MSEVTEKDRLTQKVSPILSLEQKGVVVECNPEAVKNAVVNGLRCFVVWTTLHEPYDTKIRHCISLPTFDVWEFRYATDMKIIGIREELIPENLWE